MILNKKIPLGYIIWQVRWDAIFVGLFSSAIYLLDNYVVKLTLPIQMPAFLETTISLVLAFKLNQSYDRWWEGRKIWGAIVNDSRSLVLQVLHFTGKDHGNLQKIKKITYRQIAWCYVLGKHLRKQDPITKLDEFISQEERDFLSTKQNIPLEIMNLNMSETAALRKDGQINDFQNIQIYNSFVRLCASMG